MLVIPFGDGWFRAIAWDRLREQAPLHEPVTLEEMRDAFERIAGRRLRHDRDALEFEVSQRASAGQALPERPGVSRGRCRPRALADGRPGHEHRHRRRDEPGLETGRRRARIRSPWLLDSYEAERHPVGASVLPLTDALNQLVLGRSAIRRALRRLVIASILRFPISRRLAAERLSGISIAYPRGSREDDWMVGRRMPDIECEDARLYEVMRSGRFVLVTAAGTDAIAVDWPGVDHVVHTDRTLPAAILVRPDGYIAWATRRPPVAAQLSAVLSRWCGQRANDQCAIG